MSYEPRWQQCLGHCRCQECGEMVEVTWRWFSAAATWTRAYCEACVAIMLARPTQ